MWTIHYHLIPGHSSRDHLFDVQRCAALNRLRPAYEKRSRALRATKRAWKEAFEVVGCDSRWTYTIVRAAD